MTVGSREDLFSQAKHIDDTERLIGRVLAGEWMNHPNIYTWVIDIGYIGILNIVLVLMGMGIHGFL